VELTGEARGSTVLKSPVTGKDCVFYRYEVRREGSPDFEVISERQSDDFPFWIDDGTGIIMVVPKGAELIMEPVYKFETKEFRRLPDTVAAFLKKYDIEYKGMNRLYRFFIREWIIQPDQSVYVMGTAKKIDEPGLYLDRSFRPASASGDGGDVTDVIIGKGDPWQTFIISDRNQSQLQSDLSDWAGWSIIGGAAAVIVTFVYLVFRIRGILAGGF
jgi:hypothetical protein